MMKKLPFSFFPVLSCLIFLCQTSFAQESGHIYIAANKTDDLKAKEGQKVIVYGETKGSGKSGSGTNFVNFKGAEFYLITFKSDLNKFKDGEPADVFDGKRIAVEGVITVYKNKPQIKLVSPDVVTELGEDEEFPPKVEKEVSNQNNEKIPVGKTVVKENKSPVTPKKKPPVDPKKYFK